jgi:hypothetical protein
MKIIQAILLGLLLTPCFAADKAKKQESLLLHKAIAAHSIDEAIANTQAVPLAPGGKVKRALTQDNPVLEMEGQRVLYDVYAMSGRSGHPFQLTVFSYCKCFGFDKTIVVPKTIVISNGKPLTTQITTAGKEASGLTPLHYETTVTGTFDSDGPAYVLLYGDTGDIGSTLATAGGGSTYVAAAGTSIEMGTFDITKSPVGKIALELKVD